MGGKRVVCFALALAFFAGGADAARKKVYSDQACPVDAIIPGASPFDGWQDWAFKAAGTGFIVTNRKAGAPISLGYRLPESMKACDAK